MRLETHHKNSGSKNVDFKYGEACASPSNHKFKKKLFCQQG